MMLVSPPLFSTTYGWPLEDLITPNLQQDCNEANSYHSLLDIPSFDQIQQDFAPEKSNSSGGAVNGDTVDNMTVGKKLNHNASERDRRKRVNDLYAFLRSLLPMSTAQKKKVSIPGTVSHALKYIAELQKEVERLIRKKEQLSSCFSPIHITGVEHLDIRNQKSANDATIQTSSTVVSSVSFIDEKEAVIQLISLIDRMNKNKEIGFLSKTMEYLEQEEDGFV
ncbi:Achaete-scute transcription factor-related protein [Cynara cardunculus var. scolymus]|uniref:Achaete-scute transcription factor-related protein n=1 Tax=Cynara cardunculus var. scolymus TaxID=59895 RepID=A0A118K1W0_CYNCS|nr:Achaete-scute transcription factor-related protein [Cynara cardunculus var. scolymus]